MNLARSIIVGALALTAFGCADDATDPRAPLVSNNGTANGGNVNGSNVTTTNNGEPNGEPNLQSNGETNAEIGPAKSWVIGRSISGRPIVAELYGESGPVLFLLSAIHGDERLAITFGERIRARLLSGLAERSGARIYFVNAGNPDGIVSDSRVNARGVDLNRNFPADNFDPSAGGGDEPLSEPESMALYESIQWIDPAAVVSVHCCAPTLDWDGPAEPLAEAMSLAMDPSIAFETIRLGSRPGSLGSYIGIELERPIITVEFDLGNGTDPSLQLESMVEAVEAAAFWTGENGVEPTVTPSQEIIEEEFALFDSFIIGRSADGEPIRVDRVGFEAASNGYLVSGIDGASRRGEWIAEHIRADRILELRHGAGQGIHFVTGLNPDGWSRNGTINGAGVDVLADLGGDPTTPEAGAFWDWIENAEPGVVYVVEDGPTEQVTIHGPRTAEARRIVPFQFLAPAEDLSASLEPFVTRLVESGQTVVVLEISEEYFEAQGISDGNPGFRPSPTVYSDLVEELEAGL